jgi:hypothetical protein
MSNIMNRMEIKETIDFILDNIDNSRIVLNSVANIRDQLIDLTLDKVISEQDLYRISSVLTPQSRSPMWENYFIEKYDCEKVKRNEDRGDLRKNGIYYEYKASGYNLDNSVNIVQIRPWQDCDYIIQSISDDGATTFVLTHAEMILEMKRLKASPAHGTKEVVADNKKIEYMMTVERGSADWDRWVNNYCKEGDIFNRDKTSGSFNG